MWTIRKVVKKGDYLYAVVPEHPNCTRYGYVLEHRVVMEIFLNRLLTNNEVVHHINENKHDNRIENLEVMSLSEHTRLHVKTGRTYETLVCPNCGKEFLKERRQMHSKTTVQHKCSRKCNGEHSRKIQLGRL